MVWSGVGSTARLGSGQEKEGILVQGADMQLVPLQLMCGCGLWGGCAAYGTVAGRRAFCSKGMLQGNCCPVLGSTPGSCPGC